MPNLRAFYAELAKEMAGTRGWDVGVFVDRGDLTRELYGKLRTEGTYEWWESLYDQFGRTLLPMAEFLGFEGDAVMRMRDSTGVCSEVTLAGRNFLRVNKEGIEFDILKIYYHPLPADIGPAPGDEAMVSVYARASRFPDQRQARGFSRMLQRRFRQKRVIIHIRTDSYFLTDEAFPILYRFDEKPIPPSRAQYEQSEVMYCTCDHPGILCRVR